ncbi:hypothetical protein ACFVVA_28945 [Kitasatospora sp. NPDC058048]|uniref:hypothetical protein n=1 Tax=Kitasatospora sp. NPDC058048 TaxID=3346313 RepID=UPI0036D8823D
MSTSEDRVAALIAQAAQRRAAAAARRARYNTARQAGLAARHHLKLTRLAQQPTEPPADSTEPEPPDAA